jgi:hypothetical protein
MGPAPMMRMEWMSLRRGMEVLGKRVNGIVRVRRHFLISAVKWSKR